MLAYIVLVVTMYDRKRPQYYVITSLQMKVTEEAGLDSTVRLRCHGIKNTWSHQRKRRRLIECLDRQRKEDKGMCLASKIVLWLVMLIY